MQSPENLTRCEPIVDWRPVPLTRVTLNGHDYARRLAADIVNDPELSL